MTLKTRLCLGCGLTPDASYYNVDIRASKDVDLVCDIRTLEFPPERFIEILAKDVLEHISFVEAKKLMRKCYGWLQPHGALIIHFQDMRFCALEIAKSRVGDEEYTHEVLRWIYGSPGEGETDYLHGWHRWGYTKESLCKILKDIGFKIVYTEVTCNGLGLLVIAGKDGVAGAEKTK
jgi:predicted SAM-dependent methyltransferase